MVDKYRNLGDYLKDEAAGKLPRDNTLMDAIYSAAFANGIENPSLLHSEGAENIGIFKHKNPDSRIRLSHFLNGTLTCIKSLGKIAWQEIQAEETNLSLQQLNNYLFARDCEYELNTEVSPNEITQDNRKKEFSNLAKLALSFSAILDPSTPGKQNVNMPRYFMQETARIYAPQNERLHNRAFMPLTYSGETPANITFQIDDQVNGNQLILDFFPIPYGYYKGFQDYDGVSPEIALELITKRSSRMWSQDRGTHDIVTEGAKTYKPASLNIRLRGKDRQTITRLSGNLIQKQVGKQKVVGYYYKTPSVPGWGVFLPFENIEASNKRTVDGFQIPTSVQLVRDLMACDIKY